MSSVRPGDLPETAENSEAPLLAGRYAIQDRLGQGRFTVYRGRDERLQRRVAIKEVPLAHGHEGTERVRLRAMREARSAARLNNPNVVTVYDVVEENGSIWLVMELVDASSLAQIIKDEGPLTHERVAHIGLGVLDALRSAHAVGVVHRDVKPANVLVGRDDHPKLADFGVATILDESRVTAAGSIIGSPSYMAPEQAMAAQVGPPADMWALGATLYFAVEGTSPFARDSAIATAAAVVGTEPRPQENRGPLTVLIERLLDKKPERRPQSDQVRALLVATTDESPGDSTLVAADPSPLTSMTTPSGAVEMATSPTPTPDDELVWADDSPGEPAEPTAATDAAGGAEAVGAQLPAVDGSAWRQRLKTPGVVALLLLVLVLAGVTLWGFVGGDDGDDGEDVATRSPAQDEQDEDPAGQAGDETATGETSDQAGDEIRDDDGSRTEPADDTTDDGTATKQPGESSRGSASNVPDGWALYEDDSAGYVIAYPEGWQIEPAGGPRVDFRDPDTGSYLRVDWTDQPKDDPVADWRAQAKDYASRHDGYQEIRIEPYDYRDYNAAIWEFRYRSGGSQLHVANLGFVTGDRGYALLFQTPESHWDGSQDIYATFRETFRPG